MQLKWSESELMVTHTTNEDECEAVMLLHTALSHHQSLLMADEMWTIDSKSRSKVPWWSNHFLSLLFTTLMEQSTDQTELGKLLALETDSALKWNFSLAQTTSYKYYYRQRGWGLFSYFHIVEKKNWYFCTYQPINPVCYLKTQLDWFGLRHYKA